MPIVEFLLIIALLLIAVFLYYGFKIAPWRLRVRKQQIPAAKTKGSFAGKRAVFFSDVHWGPVFTTKHLERLCDLILEQDPQLILFGGDLVEEKTDLANAHLKSELIRQLTLLSEYCPCYAVLGNHDVETVRNRLYTTEVLTAAGFTILENGWADLEDLALYGFKNATHDFPAFIDRPDLAADDIRLLLCHEPDFVGKYKPVSGNALYLSGHSHGGQVTLFGLPLILPYLGRRYVRGWHQLNENNLLLISNGVGTVHIHARFCARPDIQVLDFAVK